ncbi:MAG TPA: ATP-binding protein [Candidatus Eisenbacteria bacterium]|nr:ATP-binding protein [Candidatus Eisenbacteria bacterium]
MQRTHPADYRPSLLFAAVVAMAVWWGLGLPYSITAWLLDAQQLKWTLICYAWEVPVAGLLGPVLVPQIWWRDVMRRWDRVFATPGQVDAVEAGIVEGKILNYPFRVGWVLLVTSLVGYAVGALQLYLFAQLPLVQLVHVGLLGMVTGLVGALFAFLYLERLLVPLLLELGLSRPTAAPAGRRVPLRTKVFASSLVLMIATVPLFGTVFWNQAARVLEQESGKRLLVLARDATGPAKPGAAGGAPAWQALAGRADLGASGRVYVVDGEGRVLAGTGPARRLADEGFRPAVLAAILGTPDGHLVDRTHLSRVIAFAEVPGADRHVVVVVPTLEFDQELRHGLRTAAAIFLATLSLALGSSFLFARRLTRPIEVVTAVANRSARGPDTAWELAPVRTNDEVGELAVALNLMTSRLGEARDALARSNIQLEDRVAAATRNIRSLYDTTRTITSTLELEDVLRLIGERIVASLGLRDLVLIRCSPVDSSVEVYATSRGRLVLGPEPDLEAIAGGSRRPSVGALAAVDPLLPPIVRAALTGPEILRLPLVFKDELLGLVLASLPPGCAAPDLDFADAIASQTAVALANVGLYETVHRHEIELRELSERQVQMREDMLRGVSRDLHDGLGQALAAIKFDLGSIEQTDDATNPAALRERVRGVQAQVTELMQEVRRMSQLLRPTMLDDLGLIPSLRLLVESIGARAGVAITLSAPTVERRLPPAIEVLLYRVTQEALTNIVRHAQARSARVDLTLGATHAMLTISDDGIGFDVEELRRRPTPSGMGLLGMRERVAYHRGWIDIRSRPREGVSITLRIPIDAA